MSECKLDHSQEDVKNKYEFMAQYLPADFRSLFEAFFLKQHTQKLLNEMFHLLKKYDLASEEEREQRNNRMMLILKNS